MNHEFFEALRLFEKEKGISAEYLAEKITAAIVAAVKRAYEVEENILVEIDPVRERFYVALVKEVVEQVEDGNTQIQVDEAKRFDKQASVGASVEVPLETKQFGRIAAGAAKQIIRQGIREAERSQMFKELQSKSHEIVSAQVLKIDPENGALILDMGKYQSVLPLSEQVEEEVYQVGDHIKIYIADVMSTERGPRAMISRTHEGLVKRLFEMEVPEVFDGLVEIKSISREAGSRTKIAVYSKDENVDPIGACIGPKGSRIEKIIDELKGEKIDIVHYSEDPQMFIAEALSPAKVVEVELLDTEAKTCKVIVPDGQLSLAIGNRGQNAKLAARLTGWKIDIKPESGFYGEES